MIGKEGFCLSALSVLFVYNFYGSWWCILDGFRQDDWMELVVKGRIWIYDVAWYGHQG